MSRETRLLTVLYKERLTPHMVRIILGGDSLKNFPEGFEGGYVKLCFDQNGQPLSQIQSEVQSEKQQAQQEQKAVKSAVKPVMRSYSIRSFDALEKTLTIDCADHTSFCEGKGPAAGWVESVNEGDHIAVNGPGAVQRVNHSTDWVLLAGDITALPAIACNLEALPYDVQGYAVIEIFSEEDRQPLIIPSRIELHWVINSKPDCPNSLLADKVKSLPWLEGSPGVWLACEFESMRTLRRYFRQEKSLARENLYASSYWKMGETDEGNKLAKKQDSEAQ